MKVPVAVGVPLMVITFAAQVALTPAGKPLAASTPSLEIPVAPVVTCVIAVSAQLIHKVGELEPAAAVLTLVTVIVPVALIAPQPPVNAIE